MSLPNYKKYRKLLLKKDISAQEVANQIGCSVRAVYCLRYKIRNSQKLKESKAKYRKNNHEKILRYQREYGSVGSESAQNLGDNWTTAHESLLFKKTAREIAIKIGRTVTSVYKKRTRTK
jgi:DNA-binding CsgD family transcriptional regulator